MRPATFTLLTPAATVFINSIRRAANFAARALAGAAMASGNSINRAVRRGSTKFYMSRIPAIIFKFVCSSFFVASLILLQLPEDAVAQTYRIYFGEMHSHSMLSHDAQATAKMPAQAYAYAKNAAKIDFLAISDHTNGLPQVNYEKFVWRRLMTNSTASSSPLPDKNWAASAARVTAT